jgi:hypothetical protein
MINVRIRRHSNCSSPERLTQKFHLKSSDHNLKQGAHCPVIDLLPRRRSAGGKLSRGMTDRQRKEAAYHRRKRGETMCHANGQAGMLQRCKDQTIPFMFEPKTCPKPRQKGSAPLKIIDKFLFEVG